MAHTTQLPALKREQRLRQVNQLLLPLLRAAHRYTRAWRVLKPDTAGVTHVTSSTDYTVTVVKLDLPASNPLVVALYVSAQESSPITPSQLKSKIKRVRMYVEKLRNKYFATADIIYLILAPRGFTGGARRQAYAAGVNLAETLGKAAAILRRYISSRLSRLAQAVRGRRIWGELPLLLYSLQEIARELGHTTSDEIKLEEAVKAALEGGILIQ